MRTDRRIPARIALPERQARDEHLPQWRVVVAALRRYTNASRGRWSRDVVD
jgi:hypothetical protein